MKFRRKLWRHSRLWMDICDAAQGLETNQQWQLTVTLSKCETRALAPNWFPPLFLRADWNQTPPLLTMPTRKATCEKGNRFFKFFWNIAIHSSQIGSSAPMSSIEKRSSAIKCFLFLFNLTASSQISIQSNTHTRAHTEKQKNIAGPQLEFFVFEGKKKLRNWSSWSKLHCLTGSQRKNGEMDRRKKAQLGKWSAV